MKYFLMSTRFNKQSPQDFGLMSVNGKFIRADDRTEWISCQLFDLGWGEENGFYKVPLGSFEELMRLVLCDDDLEDSYGAAAMILKQYTVELKAYLLDITEQKAKFKDRKKLRKLNQLFNLQSGSNLTCQVGMPFGEMAKEHNDWKQIAHFFNSTRL